MPAVYNKYHGNIPAGAVYIGRPSKWGNPFPLEMFESRDKCLIAYREWLKNQPQLVAAIKTELRGKNLVCFCAPKLCHGDVLLEIANNRNNC